MKKRLMPILFVLIIVLCAISFCGCEKIQANSYDIAITLDTQAKTFTAVQETVYVHNSSVATDKVCFNLYQNTTSADATYTAVPKDMKFQAYPNGDSYGMITIENVKIGENNAEFEIAGTDENFLIVSLDTPLCEGESVVITMEYTVVLANINSRLGYGEDTINLGNFYPILAVFEESENSGEFYECIPYSLGDPFYSDVADYNVSITLSNEYVVASSGAEVDIKINGDSKTISFEADDIRSFCLVCSDNFSVQTQIKNGIEINYYYIEDASPTKTTALIANTLDLFEDSFGEYEYDTFSVVDANFFQGGMEYSALVMVSLSAPTEYRKVVIVHETAHQWWQTMVGTNEIETSIIDEGLAEFSTRYFFETYPEYGVDSEAMIAQKQDTYDTYLQILNVLDEPTPPTPTKSLSEYRSTYDYYALVYVKGQLLFEEISTTVGQEEFINYLKKLKTQYNLENITIEDLIALAELEFGTEVSNQMQNLFYT
ncbi:MAG: M1 family metallopeptidase [Bacillota bacterium]